MKKFILIIMLSVLTVACTCDNSQDKQNSTCSIFNKTQEHLKFKGIPIDGNYRVFAEKLLHQGFEIIGEDENNIMSVSGDFAGFKDCLILFSPISKDNNTICSVSVNILPQRYEDWKSVYDTYNFIKTELIKKYGKPTYCEEKFNVSCSSNKSKYDALMKNEGTFITVFECKNGSICLSITETAGVNITYGDKINNELCRSIKSKDL